MSIGFTDKKLDYLRKLNNHPEEPLIPPQFPLFQAFSNNL